MEPIKLPDGRAVLAAFATPASGPGWSNALVTVIVIEPDGRLAREHIQPDEQTTAMLTLYAVSAAVSGQMASEAARVIVGREGE